MTDALMIGMALGIIIGTGVITWKGNDPEDDGVTSMEDER